MCGRWRRLMGGVSRKYTNLQDKRRRQVAPPFFVPRPSSLRPAPTAPSHRRRTHAPPRGSRAGGAKTRRYAPQPPWRRRSTNRGQGKGCGKRKERGKKGGGTGAQDHGTPHFFCPRRSAAETAARAYETRNCGCLRRRRSGDFPRHGAPKDIQRQAAFS